jgi:hypothetical protein
MSMERNPWQPDPEKVAARLEGVKAALEYAQQVGAPPEVLDRYREEIQDIERWLAEPQPEPQPLDDLTRQTLIHAFSKGMSDGTPGGIWRIGLADITGLPLSVPNVPAGLPPDEAERWEAQAWIEQFSQWAEILAARWKLHDPRHGEVLARIAARRGSSREATKLRLVWIGMLEALELAGESWSGRVGSGTGSAKVETVPQEAGSIGQLKWFAQEALRRASLALLQDEDERVHRPAGEADLPSGAEERMEDLTPNPEAALVAAEDALVAEETTRERVAAIYEAARGKEAQKLDALLRHLRAGHDPTEARRLAAEDLGVQVNAIDLTLSRLRKRLVL